jgi:hypothetical protein
MTHEDFRLLIGVVQWLITCAAALYAWQGNRQSARAAEVKELDRRVLSIEEKIQFLPSKDLISELHGDLKALKSEVRSDMTSVTKQLVPLVRSVDRINDYLLNTKK